MSLIASPRGSAAHPVDPAGHHPGRPAERGERHGDDLLGRLAAMRHLAGHVLELGGGRARLDDEDVDPAAAQLRPQRLTKEEVEGLGGAVDAVQGQRLAPGHRAGDDDRAPAAGTHAREKPARQHDGRHAVHLDHGAQAVGRELVEAPGVSEAGVVDEHANLEAGDGVGEPVRAVGSGEVGRNDAGGDAAGLLELAREGAKAIFAARGQHTGHAARGQRAGEFAADPGRGAGHERPLAVPLPEGRRLCHGGRIARPLRAGKEYATEDP